MEWRTPLSSRRTSTHQPLSNMYCTLFILNPELTDARDDVVYPTLSPFAFPADLLRLVMSFLQCLYFTIRPSTFQKFLYFTFLVSNRTARGCSAKHFVICLWVQLLVAVGCRRARRLNQIGEGEGKGYGFHC